MRLSAGIDLWRVVLFRTFVIVKPGKFQWPRHRAAYIVIVALFTVVVLAVVLSGMGTRIGRMVERAIEGEPPGLHVDVPRSLFPVKGIDVSHHNGNIDFRKVAADSVDFVIIKATEGVDFSDSCMIRNYRGAVDAGLRVGFYHFFRFDRGGVRQGRHFMARVQDLPADLPLVIDVETAHNDESVDYYKVVGRLRDMIGYLRRHGRRVMIYCNHKAYDSYIRGNFDELDLWLASGRIPEDGDTRHLWQHSHHGRVNGIDSEVDINTFNGSRRDFEIWISSGVESMARTTAEVREEARLAARAAADSIAVLDQGHVSQ